jgi:hypothetical protein
VSFFFFFFRRVRSEWMRREAVVGLRRGPTISTVWADGRPIPTITKKISLSISPRVWMQYS